MSFTEPFSFDTIENFDEHIAQSIPNYHSLADSVRSIAPYYLQKDTAIVDLGCSTAELLKSIKNPYGLKYGYDLSLNLLPAMVTNELVLEQRDITDNEPFPKSSLVLSLFTLQFIEPTHRLDVLTKVHDCLVTGGAFIWAEKVNAKSGYWERIFNGSHFDFKRQSFTSEQILEKEKDIRSIMKPWTTDKNLGLARTVGFADIALFWKMYNFECYIMVKE